MVLLANKLAILRLPVNRFLHPGGQNIKSRAQCPPGRGNVLGKFIRSSKSWFLVLKLLSITPARVSCTAWGLTELLWPSRPPGVPSAPPLHSNPSRRRLCAESSLSNISSDCPWLSQSPLPSP